MEINKNIEDEIRQIVLKNPRNYSRVFKSRGFKHRCPDNTHLLEYIKTMTPKLETGFHTLKTRIFWVLNHLEDFPTCKVCGKRLVNVNVNKLEQGYPNFCSRDCMYESEKWRSSVKDGFKKKYGVDNYFKTDEFKSNMKQEKLDYLVDSLEILYNRKTLHNEFDFFRNKSVETSISRSNSHNNIVKFFQQDTFFKNEKKLWMENPKIKAKLIDNRCKFLNKTKDELTVNDILLGFKRSGIYYGYSHFNPLWFKYFIDKYNVHSCYDPCGGWGHRLLGGLTLERYIYNDLSFSTKCNVDRIIDYFDIKNSETHCEDARYFIPECDFEAMFTCPPYYNIEHYECGDFSSKKDYFEFLDSIFDVFNKKETCRIFGLVIREDLLGKHVDYIEKIPLNVGKSDHLVKEKNDDEYMFIFKKKNPT